MSLLNRTLAAALVAGAASSFAGSASAVPLGASLALRDAATPMVETVQWRRWGGWGGFGFGLAAGALIGGALASPYYGYGGYGGYGYGGYGCYGCYPAYSYGYSYGYPAYSYAYAPSYYSYGYAPAYSYSYGYPGYYAYPRVRYRAAFYRPWRRW